MQVFAFRSDFSSLVKATIQKVVDKTPIAYSFARNMACLDPKLIVAQKEVSCARFRIVLKKLAEVKRVSTHNCDNLGRQYDEFVERAARIDKTSFEDFNLNSDRLDVFLYNHIGSTSSLSNLWKLIKKLLILSHGQASVERGFSVNRQVMLDNMKEQTFVAQRTIHDHIRSISGLSNLVLSKELLSSAIAGRQRYLSYLKEQRQQKEEAAQSRKRKSVCDEKIELEKKKKRLAIDIAALNFDADKYAKDAYATANQSLLAKSIAFRDAVRDKEVLLEEINNNIKKLENAG